MGLYSMPCLSQFDYALAHTRETPHPDCILGQTGLPWRVGSMSANNQERE